MKNVIKIKAVLSSLLLIDFIVVIFTGMGLYFAPAGRIAKINNWNFLGFEKSQLENMHTLFGFIMLVLIIIHLSLNYKMFLSELKILFKKQSKIKEL